MATSSVNIVSRLESSATTAFNLSNKFFKVIQAVPSASLEYTDLAEQFFSAFKSLEAIRGVIPALDLADGSKVLGDLVKLLDFLEDAFTGCMEALPHRRYDGLDEVDLILPYEIDSLLEQLEALCVASNLIHFVLQLGVDAKEKTSPESQHSPTSTITAGRLAEGFVNQTRRMVRTLKLSQPRENNIGRRAIVPRRGEAHAAVIGFLDHMVRDIPDEVSVNDVRAGGQSKGEGCSKSDKEAIDELERINNIKFDHFGSDPAADGMPAYIRHNPDQVYAKIHKKDVDQKSLDFYGLPWSMLKDDANYFIIWKQMELWECDSLFDHTKKLRIDEEQASINARSVIERLLRRWVGVESAEMSFTPTPDEDFRRFSKDLEKLIKRDEAPPQYLRTHPRMREDSWSRPRPMIRERSLSRPRPFIRERSFSPPRPRVRIHRRFPPPRHYDTLGDHEVKTEYWRPWGDQNAQLFSSLKFRGWQPVYMRGTDAGQTWFYGPEVVHIRRFQVDYTPQEGPIKGGSGTEEYLVISTEWIEEEALTRIGFQYELLPSGYFSLDPRITWGDIELLLGATSTFREERLYRKYRGLPQGDLHESQQIAVPHADFLHGPKLDVRSMAKDSMRRSTERTFPLRSKLPKQETIRDTDDTFTDNFVEVSNGM